MEHGHVEFPDDSPTEADFEMAFRFAVTTTVCVVAMLLAVVANVAVEVAAGTVTEDGTVSKVLSTEIATERLAGVAELNVMVHVPVAPEDNVVGAHARDVKVTAGIRLIEVVFVPPLSAAVIVAVSGLAIVPTVALNTPVVAPATMATEAGMARLALLSESVTISPPVGAT